MPVRVLAALALLLGSAVALIRPWPGGEPAPAAARGEDPGPARLQFEPCEHDLGCVPAGEDRVFRVRWRREGEGPLRLLGTRAGCGCVGLEGLPTRLEAGASGRLTVTLRVPTEPGPLDVSVRFVTDAAPPHDVLALRLRGYVGAQAVVRPAWLDLGRRSPGAHVSAHLEVSVPPGSPAAVVCELLAWGGEVRVLPAPRAERPGGELELVSILPSRPGACVGALRVTTAAGVVLVPLRAEVVSAATTARAVNGP